MAHLNDAEKLDVISTYQKYLNLTKTAATCGVSRKAARHTVDVWQHKHTFECQKSTRKKRTLSEAAATRASHLMDEGKHGGPNRLLSNYLRRGLHHT